MRTEEISKYIEINGKKVIELHTDNINTDEHINKRQVFIIGSKGIPAAYGGFETFVEKLTEHQMSSNIRYHIAKMGKEVIRYEYNGAECFEIRVPNIGSAKAILYDLIALKYCINYCKKRKWIEEPIFYILACRIGPFIRGYKQQIKKLGGTLYVNPDGHEWKRARWSALIRKYWKISEEGMVKHADLLICDSLNIEKYIEEKYKKYTPNTMYIAYGSDVLMSALSETDKKYTDWMEKNALTAKWYYLVVGRFVPENNFEAMIKGFMESNSKKDLVIITTINDSFLCKLENKLKLKKDRRIKFVGTVYDQELLKKVRENAYGYIHGHEVGGTNPSLLEALSSTKLNLLLDVVFNREVAGDAALYWKKNDISRLVDMADVMSKSEIEAFGEMAKARIKDAYSWEFIVEQYERLFLK